ncbi:MAG TPA: alpha/beta hydrolase [Thiotrichaceae bacterium]|jgi:fermentation-respiration switch protein FrsA (DUF1100 family)|nr:alpha/beta hydrolase [Thiotrichaceae bacterium]
MLQSLVFILVTSWILFSLFIYFYQSKLIYFPSNEIATAPKEISHDYEELTLNTRDDINLNARWYKNPNARATLLFFHGNAGNISHRPNSIDIFYRLGLSILIIDYRGYGKSSGSPSESGTYLDAETAWTYLTIEKNIAPDNIIIFGRSLGAAIAIWLAEKHSSAALIVESSFTSIADMGKHYYPFLPTELLTRIKYPSENRISKITMPLLVIHSVDDDLIPYQHGQKLFKAAKEPKTFLSINGGHNDGFIISGKKYIEGMDRFITDIIEK